MWMETININPDFDCGLLLIKMGDPDAMVLGRVPVARQRRAVPNRRSRSCWRGSLSPPYPVALSPRDSRRLGVPRENMWPFALGAAA